MEAEATVALIGNPNAGKTSIFNRLTGLRQRVGNYPGVTVEQVEGRMQSGETNLRLIDLPGTYSLDPLSPDEEVSAGVLRGELEGFDKPDAVIVVVDATTLERSLGFVGEVLACGLPTIVVLTMIDELKARGGSVNMPRLHRNLGVPVVGVVGNRGLGIDDLRAILEKPSTWHPSWSDVPLEEDDEATRRSWAARALDEVYKSPQQVDPLTEKLDRVILHPVWGIVVFALVMIAFFQSIFALAAPLQDLAEGGVIALGELLRGVLPDGAVQSLLVDGVIGGVGAVVVFVPQIAILLLLIALMEGSGYLARAAFVVDRVMGRAGLEGRSFIALLSSFACAVPGIMATRAVPDPRARLTTIMVAPLMTCSARLPVYTLLIAAFIPQQRVLGLLNLQGLVLLGLYLLGGVTSLLAAALFKRGLKRGLTFPFYLELPPYRRPTASAVISRMNIGVVSFLKKAGTVILAASIVLWFLLNFPQLSVEELRGLSEAQAAALQVEASYAGQLGHALEGFFAPLGFDWRLTIGIIASLAAREVIVSTLGQIFALSDPDTAGGLAERLTTISDGSGAPLYTLATALSLLVFYVFALQCVSTLAVMRRETGAWRWPAIAFAYMFALAYLGAWITYQLASAFL